MATIRNIWAQFRHTGQQIVKTLRARFSRREEGPSEEKPGTDLTAYERYLQDRSAYDRPKKPEKRSRYVLVAAALPLVILTVVFLRGRPDFDKGLENPPGIIDYLNDMMSVDPMIADEKIAPFYPSRMSTEPEDLSQNMFEESEFCETCHSDIYEQWQQSVMSYSWEDPIYQAILKRASVATQGAVDNFCIGCHSPIGLTTGIATAGGEMIPDAQNVDCESCHNISGATGSGNGAFILTPQKFGEPLKFGPRKDSVSPHHDTAYLELYTKSEYCATCHNVTHPFNKVAVERTYEEWRDSPYNGMGIQCQDCHMTPGPGVTENPGKAAPDGKERQQIYSHFFTGANVTLHEHFDESEMAERARQMLKSSATIEFVDTPATIPAGWPITVGVKVTNVGAGHKLPTGFPEGREVWIDFRVKDAQGKEIYRLGAIRDGHTEEGTKNFKVIIADSDGNVVDINVWEAARILCDTRILPMGYAKVDYTFMVPPDAKTPLTITADLNYWSFPQKIVDEILGEGELEVEITRMTAVEQVIKVEPVILSEAYR
ncbi:MAG: multiheme c-type cytochrome [bacterium]